MEGMVAGMAIIPFSTGVTMDHHRVTAGTIARRTRAIDTTMAIGHRHPCNITAGATSMVADTPDMHPTDITG